MSHPEAGLDRGVAGREGIELLSDTASNGNCKQRSHSCVTACDKHRLVNQGIQASVS